MPLLPNHLLPSSFSPSLPLLSTDLCLAPISFTASPPSLAYTRLVPCLHRSALILCRRIVSIRFWACLASGSVTWAVCRRPLSQRPTSCPPTLYFSSLFYLPPRAFFPCISSSLPPSIGLSRPRAICGMQYVRSISGSVSKTWNSINPATLSGAIDVIVIEQEDGKCLVFCLFAQPINRG